MVGFGAQHHNWVAEPDSAAAADDEEEFPAYAEPIERSDTDYYYDFESDQLRGAWPSKTTMPPPPPPVRGRQPPAASGRWPTKAASEGPQRAQPHYDHYGDYPQSQEHRDYPSLPTCP